MIGKQYSFVLPLCVRSSSTHGEPSLKFPRYGLRKRGIVSFETHQLHCIRSRLTAAIVEGDEDDIRAVHYLWALQQTEEEVGEDTPDEQRWQVTELAVRGMMSTY